MATNVGWSIAAQHCKRLTADVFDREAVFAQQHLSGCRGAKTIDAEHVAAIADVAVPALRRSRFDCKARTHRRRQYGVAIFARLRVEELPTRHGDDAYLDLLRRELLRCRDDQSDLRPGRDQNKLSVAIRRIG